jgi:hypothetical protein
MFHFDAAEQENGIHTVVYVAGVNIALTLRAGALLHD